MAISLYSFVMAVVWSSVLIVIMFSCRRNNFFVSIIGIPAVLILFIGSLIRCFIPIDLPFAKVITSENIYTAVDTFARSPLIITAVWTTPLNLFLSIWITVSLLLGVRKALIYRKFSKYVAIFNPSESQQINRVGEKAVKNLKLLRSADIICSDAVRVPAAMGFIHWKILLPEREYTDEELLYILLHEYTHLKNNDPWIKLFVEIFCIVFWWNPLSYLLKVDLGQTLELKCDFSVVSELDDEDKISYLKTILALMKETIEGEAKDTPFVTSELFDLFGKDHMPQRFRMVLSYRNRPRQFKLATLIWGMLITVVMIFSYAFIVQPRYEPQIGKSDLSYSIKADSTYIIEHKDGSYSLATKEGVSVPIQDSSIEMLLESGYQIIKEE